MPLTPAEVHNVAFKKPPIGKRGYDEEEVDSFLDVVEVELSRLIEENNDLRGRGTNGTGAAGTPVDITKDAGHPDAAPAELTALREENERLQAQLVKLEKALSQGKNGAQQQVVQLQQQLEQTERQLAESRAQLEQAQRAVEAGQQSAVAPAEGGGASMEHHTQAVQLLALAQQTADTHLAQAKAEAERLLTDAQASSDSTLTSAQQQAQQQLAEAEERARQLDDQSTSRATRTVRDAEERATALTAEFAQRKEDLERRVEELHTFEREYRTRLKSYLESQLRDLDAGGAADPAPRDHAGAPRA